MSKNKITKWIRLHLLIRKISRIDKRCSKEEEKLQQFREAVSNAAENTAQEMNYPGQF